MTTVDVGALDDLADGVGTRLDVGEERIAVFRFGDEVFAVEVECPRHGAAFDITTGAALTLPATKPVATYPVAIVDGEVQITIGGTNT